MRGQQAELWHTDSDRVGLHPARQRLDAEATPLIQRELTQHGMDRARAVPHRVHGYLYITQGDMLRVKSLGSRLEAHPIAHRRTVHLERLAAVGTFL